MNRTMIFAAIGAMGTALLVAMLLSSVLHKNNAATPATEILVAAHDLPIGTALSSGNTHWQKWGGPAVPGALVQGQSDDSMWQKQKLRRAVTAGEPITSGALMQEGKGNLLAARLEKNMRAVSIDVKAASGVSGFLSPDDHVDVILSYSARVQANSSSNALQEIAMDKASETILENVRVLATDQDATGADSGNAKVNKTITLEVSKEGAEKLALASQMGEITLALRQMGDTEEEDKAHKDVTDVSLSRILNKMIVERNSLENTGSTIRVYGGTSVQEVPVRGTVVSQ